MAPKPLDGMKIVDMTHVLAGPYCTYQLGLLGADVIKVESLRGDMVRAWGGSQEQLDLQLGSGFAAQNAGKRSLAIDIKTNEGAQIVLALIDQADIVIENFEPGSLAQYGLDHACVRKRRPDIIYASISAFGQTGPHGHRPGFDDVVQATSGFMSINVRGDGPIRTGGPVLDYATGMHAASAILAAVLLKHQTGEGQHIDIAMQDVTMLLINRNTSIAATTGEPPAPAENREGPLLGRYRAKDGYVMLAGYLPRHWRGILRAVGLDSYAGLPTPELSERMAEVESEIEKKIAERTAEEWDNIFSKAKAVAGGVRSLDEVLATGQPEARELLSSVETAAGNMQVTNSGYRINNQTYRPKSGIPRLGEHTREILSDLGYDGSQIEDLVGKAVVRVV